MPPLPDPYGYVKRHRVWASVFVSLHSVIPEARYFQETPVEDPVVWLHR